MSPSTTSLLENALIKGKWASELSDTTIPTLDLAKKVVEGDFKAVLTSPAARSLFSASTTDLDQELGKIFNFTKSLDSDPVTDELYRLCIAIACLHSFVQANWTGPDLSFGPLDLLPQKPESLTEQALQARSTAELAYSGEPAYHLSKYPAFLRFAQLIIEGPFLHLRTPVWWRLRTELLHQQTLDEPVAHVLSYETELEALSSFVANDSELAGRLNLERGLIQHLFSQDRQALEYFIKAARATGMEYELSGALGKRTKFQVTEVSQLVLLAESKLKDDSEVKSDTLTSDTATDASITTEEAPRMPENLALNDDTLLEQTEFTSSRPDAASSGHLAHIDPANQPPLHPLDQSILLSLCLNVKNTMPSHGLTNEQMSPYVARVITHPRNWSVHTMALLLRSRLESQRTRTVERSTFQLAALIDQMPSTDSTITERLVHFHSILLPSKWEMERELALRYMSIGVIKSALEIFERLEMWEDAVKCQSSLGRAEQGIAIVRDLLEGRKEEVDLVLERQKADSERRRAVRDSMREAKLWCLLGDLEPEHAEEHYLRAWETSKHSSGRAMRSLGGIYFSKEKYAESVQCLKRSVKINPLMMKQWFLLGCAAMRIEDWEEARDAFQRCVAIDEEDGESWNNLASMYLRLHDTKKGKEGSNTGKEVRDLPVTCYWC